MRKRNNMLSVRLSDSEIDEINEKIIKSGLPKNLFIYKSITNKPIISGDMLTEIMNLNYNTSKLIEQLKRIGVNINQLARIANKTTYLPTVKRLNEISQQLEDIKIEVSNQWQYIRQLIRRLQ